VQGLFLGGPEVLRGHRSRLVLLERVLDTWFSRVDVVVQESPVPFDIIGLPEIGFPIGFTAGPGGTELPQGAILGAAPFGEQRLLATVAAVQAVTDWHERRAPDPVALSARAAAARARRAPRLTAEEVAELTQ
jgi:hypothetical protein